MADSRPELVTLAFAILEEVAAQSLSAGITERPTWLRIVLAWLWGQGCRERGFLDSFWSSLASKDEIGRAQGLNASLNGIYRQLGRERM